MVLRIGFTSALALMLVSCTQDITQLRTEAGKLYDRGAYSDAEFHYRKIVLADPTSSESFYRLGLIHKHLGKRDESYAALRKAVQLAPGHEAATAALASLLLDSYWLDPRKPRPVYEELSALATRLLKQNPSSFEGHKVRGYLAVTDRKLGEAEARLRSAVSLRPNDVDTSAMLIQVMANAGNLSGAEQYGEKFLASHPEASIVYEVLARQYIASGRAVEAERVLRQQLDRNGTSTQARMRLARHLLDQGRAEAMDAVLAASLDVYEVGQFFELAGELERAFQVYEKGAVSGGENTVRFRKRQITIRLAQNRFAEARSLLNPVLASHGSDQDLLRSNAVLLSKGERRLQEAIAVLRPLAVKNPGDYQLLFDLGQLLASTGDMNGAQEQLKAALKIAPAAPEIRLAMSSLAMSRLDYAEALRQCDALLEVAPENQAAHIQRVAALRGLGQFSEARTALARLQPLKGASSSIELETAYLLLFEGQHRSAERIFRRLFQPGHESVRVVAGLVEALTAQAKYADALTIVQADLKQRPDRPLVLFAEAETYALSGNVPKALELHRALIERHPDIPTSYERVASLLVRSGKATESVAVLQQGKMRFKENSAITSLLAEALASAGRIAEAEQSYREWIRLDGRNPIANNNLAWLLAEQGRNLDEAVRFANAALRGAPGEAGFRDTLGYVYLRKGETGEALRIFRALAEEEPRNAIFLFHHGLALKQAGDVPASRSQMQRALDANPPGALKVQVLEALRRG